MANTRVNLGVSKATAEPRVLGTYHQSQNNYSAALKQYHLAMMKNDLSAIDYFMKLTMSVMQQHEGCDLIVMHNPLNDTVNHLINDLPGFSRQAYVFCGNGFFYVNKINKKVEMLLGRSIYSVSDSYRKIFKALQLPEGVEPSSNFRVSNLNLDNEEKVEERILQKAREENKPIIIKRNNKLSIYSYKDAMWQETELLDLLQDEQDALISDGPSINKVTVISEVVRRMHAYQFLFARELNEEELQYITLMTNHGYTKEVFTESYDLVILGGLSIAVDFKSLPGSSRYAYVLLCDLSPGKYYVYFIDKIENTQKSLNHCPSLLNRLNLNIATDFADTKLVRVLDENEVREINKLSQFHEEKDSAFIAPENSKIVAQKYLASDIKILLNGNFTFEQWMFIAMDAVANEYYETKIEAIYFAKQALEKAQKCAESDEQEEKEVADVSAVIDGFFTRMMSVDHPDFSENRRMYTASRQKHATETVNDIIGGYLDEVKSYSEMKNTFQEMGFFYKSKSMNIYAETDENKSLQKYAPLG